MRWSSHIAKGCVPAEPIARPRAAAVSRTCARSARSCRPAWAVSPPPGGGAPPRGADREAARGGGLAHLRAKRAELPAGLGGVRRRLGRDLEHGLHQLGLDLALGGVLEERLDRVDEVVALG